MPAVATPAHIDATAAGIRMHQLIRWSVNLIQMRSPKRKKSPNLKEIKMRILILSTAALLALALPAVAKTACAQSARVWKSSTRSSAAGAVIDTRSRAYPSSSSAADELATPVIAGGTMVTLSEGDSMPESASSLPPGFTDPYLAHH
jgi:hypothetical protein